MNARNSMGADGKTGGWGWIPRAGAVVGVGLGVLVVAASMSLLFVEREERVLEMRVYPVAVVESEEGWMVLKPEDRLKRGVPIRVELCETLLEVSVTRQTPKGARTYWVDEVTSVVSLRMVGREFPGWIAEDSTFEPPLECWLGRAPATWTSEAKEKALDHFAGERPDLVERVRRGEQVRVTARAMMSSVVVRCVGATVSAVLVIWWVIRAGRR